VAKIVAGRLKCAEFNIQTMLKYFLDTVAGDGQSSSNFKAISATDNKSLRLFERGYVQRIEVVAAHVVVHYRARCEPEMRSSKAYLFKLSVKIGSGSGDHSRAVDKVTFAQCSCPAGKGPYGSCKHLAALFYALDEFTRYGFTRDFVTSTEELQAWNKPHSKKTDPMLIADMTFSRKKSDTATGARKRVRRTAYLDPRATADRGQVSKALDSLISGEPENNDVQSWPIKFRFCHRGRTPKLCIELCIEGSGCMAPGLALMTTAGLHWLGLYI